VATALTALAALVTPSLRIAPRILVCWNVGTWMLIAMAWTLMLASDARATRRRAAAEDPGRLFVHVVVMLSAMLSIAAAVGLMHQGMTTHVGHETLWIVVTIGAVVGAWLLNHTSWTLRYAHLYYRNDQEGVGGLAFPGEVPPDDMDFAYFAFTIGICMQTSDVAITSRQLRRAVLAHALQSFAFNTAIIALLLNVIFGMMSR